jgi:hypothetical protein
VTRLGEQLDLGPVRAALAGRFMVTFVAGWAGLARARTVPALMALAAVVPSLSGLRDLPSFGRNATAPIDPAGCSARQPNASRGRIGDMLLAGGAGLPGMTSRRALSPPTTLVLVAKLTNPSS